MKLKVDVVVCFYKQAALWPLLVWGFLQNKNYINRIIVSNDGPYDREEADALFREMNGRLPMMYVYQPRNGFGGHRAINNGAKHVTTEYFTHIDADIVLAPYSLERNLSTIDEQVMMLGRSHDCKRDMTIAELEAGPPLLRVETRCEPHQCDPVGLFALVRDSYVTVRTEDYWAIGGHDESYEGYGFHDYDYGLRWMDKFGLDSIELGTGNAYHLSDLKPGHAFNPASRLKFIARHKDWCDRRGLVAKWLPE